MDSYKTRPFLIPSLTKALFTKYGVRDGLVYAERSRLGVDSGGPSVPVSKVTRKYHRGWIIGSVHFGEGSHEPVVWRHVLFPKGKLRRAERAMNASLVDASPSAMHQPQTVKGAHKAKSAHFGKAWRDFVPSALPRRRVATLSGPCIDNRDGTVTHVESGIMCVRAPWGMEWDGTQFIGRPVRANWTDATRLFGEGATAKYPLYFNDLSRVEGSERNPGGCRVRFAGFDDWRLIGASEFYSLFRPLERPSTKLETHHLDADDKQMAATSNEELRDHAWPDMRHLSPTLAKLFPELSHCELRIWTRDAAWDQCGWAYMGDCWESFCDVKAKEELLVLLVRDASGHEYEGRVVEDVSYESL